MNALLRKLAGKLGIRWVTGQIRAAAEGRLGPRWRRAYEAAAGHKTETGLALGAACAVCVYLGLEMPAFLTGVLSTALVGVGLLDAKWRQSPPAYVFECRWYRFLADHSADIAAAMGAVAAWLSVCSPDAASLLARIHLTCGQATVVLGCVGALAGWLGLRDAALAAPPPRPSPSPK